MTCYPFFNANTDSFIRIGTSGGWTKPSTGYTIKNSIEKIDMILKYIKEDKPLSKLRFKNRFWYYDVLFLDVLVDSKGKGSRVFLIYLEIMTRYYFLNFLVRKQYF